VGGCCVAVLGFASAYYLRNTHLIQKKAMQTDDGEGARVGQFFRSVEAKDTFLNSS